MRNLLNLIIKYFIHPVNIFVGAVCDFFNTDPRGSRYDGGLKAIIFTLFTIFVVWLFIK